jgi:FAD/FMN-containing dehydrogenase/Fe-S oxidoreductase
MFVRPLEPPQLELLERLAQKLKGEVHYSALFRLLYATDASVYREVPIAVVYPTNADDVGEVIALARKMGTSVIPRTAGTSLAGQVVGNGIVVDVSKHMTKILELNIEERWVRVQPGVILDELNQYLESFGLFFGPETSTSNRCMIGGMVGNNACGAHSLIYGSTRDHLLEVEAILSDGSKVVFGQLTNDELVGKTQPNNLEGKIYNHLFETFSQKEKKESIRKGFPHPEIKRRNTGYAIDIISQQQPFEPEGPPFNLAKLIAGSEGTLAFITSIKLNLEPIPPPAKGLVCAHFNSVNESLKANLIALKHKPVSVELIDEFIVSCTKENIEQRKNRFFVEGEPGAILIVEFFDYDEEAIKQRASAMIEDLQKAGLGYHFPLVFGNDIGKVWALRKAGLGLLSNVEGEAKPVAVIEDTAVRPEDLPNYIYDFQKLLEKYGLSCVFYAHAATGELHLRPILNLKKQDDVELFRTILHETALLVKKYGGSLSGEHGDGRLRGEFIPLMIGEENFNVVKEIKRVWDPQNVFNARKITDTPPMNSSLRYDVGQETKTIETVFDFNKSGGILGAAELCNGSADCRRTSKTLALMCPSYMATLNETDTTRARANILREFLTRSTKANPFDHQEIYEVMDLCFSCKACKSECPSNVDVAKLKAEFLHHYHKSHQPSLRTRIIGHIGTLNRLGSFMPWAFNFLITNPFFSSAFKKIVGFANQRSIPVLYKTTLRKWATKNLEGLNKNAFQDVKVLLFVDEFTDYNDVEIGIKTIKLLTTLGYKVSLPKTKVSGRTFLSKGFLDCAKKIANKNVEILEGQVSEKQVLVGIEPSAILGFRDEYLDLATPHNKESARKLANHCYMLDEFLAQEAQKGKISADLFTTNPRNVYLHGHCHQKALASIEPTKKMLELAKNYKVIEIKASCCGMAGSFGYEKEHYDVSMKAGELVLFPAVRKSNDQDIICAPGTSCRHQIKDGTGRVALHPAEVLYEAIRKDD